jgi:hypothetical protein
VQGAAADQVDAIIAAFESQFADFATNLGGPTFRTIAGFAGFFCLMLLLLSAVASIVGESTDKRWSLVSGIGPALAIIALNYLPWDRWFPGTAVYAGDASFIVRNGALIGFLGTVVGVVSIAIPIVQALFRAGKKGKSGASVKPRQGKTN